MESLWSPFSQEIMRCSQTYSLPSPWKIAIPISTINKKKQAQWLYWLNQKSSMIVYKCTYEDSGTGYLKSRLYWLLCMGLFSSVQFSPSVVSNSLQPHGLQHTRPPSPSPTPIVYSNSCPLSWWCHPTISSSVIPLSFCLQSFPASGSFQMSQFFVADGQNVSISRHLFNMNGPRDRHTEWSKSEKEKYCMILLSISLLSRI